MKKAPKRKRKTHEHEKCDSTAFLWLMMRFVSISQLTNCKDTVELGGGIVSELSKACHVTAEWDITLLP